MFFRNDKIKTALVSPYEGPYKIEERHGKYFPITIRNQNVNVQFLALRHFQRELNIYYILL